MTQPLVSCLTATYGRHTLVEQVLSCFLNQDYDDAELVILNNHPEPLFVSSIVRDHHSLTVRVVNESGYKTLGACRNRLLELAQGEFVRTWDDDDLYLPWTLSQGMSLIGDAPAFKPARSWFTTDMSKFELQRNVFEAAMLVRTDVARKYGYKESGGDEHMPLLEGIAKEGGCREIEMGWQSSYIYRWGCGVWHISGSLGSNQTVEERTKVWVEKHNDTGGGSPLQYLSMYETWVRLTESAVLEGYDKLMLRRALLGRVR